MRRFLKVRRAGSNPHRSPRLPMTLRNLGENQSLWTGPPFPTITELIRSFGEVVKQSFACCQLAGALHTDAVRYKVSVSWQAKTEIPDWKFNCKKGVCDEINAGSSCICVCVFCGSPRPSHRPTGGFGHEATSRHLCQRSGHPSQSNRSAQRGD